MRVRAGAGRSRDRAATGRRPGALGGVGWRGDNAAPRRALGAQLTERATTTTPPTAELTPAAAAAAPTFDTIIRGGTVIDPANGLDQVERDIAVKDGVIAAVEPVGGALTGASASEESTIVQPAEGDAGPRIHPAVHAAKRNGVVFVSAAAPFASSKTPQRRGCTGHWPRHGFI
eukprot:COSAG04_NODE_956_length_9189_cov_4.340044_4_plen_174_part_00